MEGWTNLDRFEMYFLNQMTADQRRAFEEDLGHEDFKREYQEYVDLMQSFKALQANRDRERLREITFEGVNQPNERERVAAQLAPSNSNGRNPTKINIMKRVMYIAAAVALILVGGLLILQEGNDFNPEKSFAQNFSHDMEGVEGLLGELTAEGIAAEKEPGVDTLTRALECLKEADYKCAIENFNLYRELNPNNSFVNYQLGLSYMSISSYAKAVEILQPLQNSDDPELRKSAQWYLALSYTMFEDNNDIACKMFLKVADDPESEWSSTAREYMEHLNCK